MHMNTSLTLVRNTINQDINDLSTKWYTRVPALPRQPSQPVWSCRPQGGEVVEDEEISDTFLQHPETQEECARHE